MPTEAKVLIFTDNDLTHINNNHFEINLVAHLLNQIHVIPVPPPRYDYYDDSHANVTNQFQVFPQVQQPWYLHFHLQYDVLYINGL